MDIGTAPAQSDEVDGLQEEHNGRLEAHKRGIVVCKISHAHKSVKLSWVAQRTADCFLFLMQETQEDQPHHRKPNIEHRKL